MRQSNQTRIDFGALCGPERVLPEFKKPTIAHVARISALLPLIMVLIAGIQPWVNPSWLFLDTLVAIERSGECCSVYYGFFSNFGILLWTGCSAICLFAALVMLGHRNSQSSPAQFALASGLFTGWLALDDLFQVHEKVFPAFGIPQDFTILIYIVLAISLVYFARRPIFRTDPVLLGSAIGFLSISVVVDHFFHAPSSIRIAIEDGAKFIGIWCWTAYFITAMHCFLTEKSSHPTTHWQSNEGRHSLEKK